MQNSMSRSVIFAAALVFAVLLGRARARGHNDSPTTAPATTSATSPTTVPEEIVENPLYLAWAKHKPGTQVEMELRTDAAGQEMTTDLTQRLIEVTPEQVVVETEALIHVPGVANPPQPQKQKKTFAPRVPKSEAIKSLLPPGAEGEMKELGTETMQIAGKSYETHVSEFGKTGGATPSGKQWRSPDMPGGLVKLESQTPVMKVQLTVTKVTEK